MTSLDIHSDLWKTAKSIINAEKTPHEAWSALKFWASTQSNPGAMKIAIFEFLGSYSTSPQAASLFPEVLREAGQIAPNLLEADRKTLIQFADKASMTIKGYPNIHPTSPTLPMAGNRPATILSFEPVAKSDLRPFSSSSPLVPANPDYALQLRDSYMKLNEKLHEMHAPDLHRNGKDKSKNIGENNE